MIVKLTPASRDGRVWMVSVPSDARREVPVDFMTAPDEQRSFLGDNAAYYEAEPTADGWDIKQKVDPQLW